MNLYLVNDLFNNLKENKFVQDFMKELSNYLEKNLSNNNFSSNSWIDLSNDDLTIFDTKITTKFRDEMLVERNNILQNYAKNINDADDIFYIYSINSNNKNSYNLYNCRTNDIVTKSIDDLPNGSKLGSILSYKSGSFILDNETTEMLENEIISMIKYKIIEQNDFLANNRIEGHIYEVGEKSSGRVWLYDLNSVNGGSDGIEEVEFPAELYDRIDGNDRVVFRNGEYQIFENQI